MANDVERDVNRYKRELKKIENQTSRIKTHKDDVKSKLVEKIEQELIFIQIMIYRRVLRLELVRTMCYFEQPNDFNSLH